MKLQTTPVVILVIWLLEKFENDSIMPLVIGTI